MTRYLHTMYRITDPDRSRGFYEALGLEFRRDMDIVRNGGGGMPAFQGRLSDAEIMAVAKYVAENAGKGGSGGGGGGGP